MSKFKIKMSKYYDSLKEDYYDKEAKGTIGC